jgi:hypothetical protein
LFQNFPEIPMNSPMKLPLLALFTALSLATFAKAADMRMEAFVKYKQVYVWPVPGWTSLDCEAPSINDKKWPEREQTLLNLRREQAASICANRKSDYFLKEAQRVTVLTREIHDNGRTYQQAEYEDRPILYRGHEEVVRFYKVRIKAKNENGEIVDYDGYVSADLLSDPDLVPNARPEPAKFCKECAMVGKKSTQTPGGLPETPELNEVASNILELTDKIEDSNFQDFKVKSADELAMFTCLHRRNTADDRADGPKDVDEFFRRFPQFVKAAEQAEEAFGVPKELVRCSMMAESGLKRRMVSKKGARGYAQIMPHTMDDMVAFGQKSPYKEMWEKLKSLNKDANLWRMRDDNNIPSATAAMAMYYRWIYDNFHLKSVQGGQCKDCSGDLQHMKIKDVILLTMSYNGGQKLLELANGRSPAEILRSPDLPGESKDYFKKIETCLRSGAITSFTESPGELQKINGKRNEEIKKLQQQIAQRTKTIAMLESTDNGQGKNQTKIADLEAANRKDEARIPELEKLIQLKANISYGNRIDDCTRRLPQVSQASQ